VDATPKKRDRIDSLTPEEVATFEGWVDRWVEWGLSAEQLTEDEWATVERGARASYRLSGLDEPEFVLRMSSPLGAALAPVYLSALLDQVRDQVRGQVGGQVRDQVWDQVGDQVGDQVRGQVGGQVWDQVRGQVGGQVRDQVWGQVWDQVRDQVGGQVGGQVWGQVRDQVRDQVGDQVRGQVGGQVRGQVRGQVGGQVMSALWYGNLDAGFISWVEWFREVGHLKLGKDREGKADAWRDANTAGPATWFTKCFASSDRPAYIHRDQNGALHSDDGPAIGWRDGWSISCWHGVRVPDDFYEWDLTRALGEANSEIRRCAIERIGWETVVDRLTLIASAPDPGNAPHEVRLYDLPDELQMYDDRARILVVENASLDKGGHRRTFGLPVPARHSDPLAAAADLFGIPLAAYKSLVRAS